MRISLLIYVLFLFCVGSVVVFGTVDADLQLGNVLLYEMNESSGTDIIDASPMANHGSITIVGAGSWGSGFFDFSNSRLDVNTTNGLNIVMNTTTCVNLKFDVIVATKPQIWEFRSGTAGGVTARTQTFYDSDGGGLNYKYWNDGGGVATASDAGTSITTGNNYTFCTVINSSGVVNKATIYGFVNGSFSAVTQSAINVINTVTSERQSFGAHNLNQTDKDLDGPLSRVGIWNRSLSIDEMLFFGNDSVIYGGAAPPAPPGDAPSVLFTSPANLSNFNDANLTLNYTLSNVDGSVNCLIFSQNNTQRFATWTLHRNDSVTAGNLSKVVNLTDADDLVALTVNCNGSNPNSGNLRSHVWVTLDRVSPVISWTKPVFPSGTRTNDTSFQLNFSAFDTNLFGKEVNVSCNGSGSFVTKYYNASADLNTTTDNETGIVDLSSTLPGTCLVQATYSDDHTAKRIPDWGVFKNGAKAELLFDTDKGNRINLKLKFSDVFLEDFEAVKGLDRYRVNYYFGGDNSVVHEYVIKLSSSFDIVDRSRFYDFPSFVTGKEWVDFNVISYYPVSYEYRYVGAGVEVTVRTRDTTLRFDSVGGLNIVNQNATFLFDATSPLINEVWPPDLFENPLLQQVFWFTATDPNPFVAYLWTNETGTWQIEETISDWNSSGNNSVVHTFGQLNHVLWAFEILDTFNNVNWSDNRTIIPFFNKPVNFTFIDEDTGLLISGENITLEIVSDVGSQVVNTSNGSIFIVLQSPLNYSLTYSAFGRIERNAVYAAVGSGLEQVTLFLGNNTQDVTFTIFNEVDDVVEGAVIEVYRFDTGSNSFVLVDTVTTDFQGQAVSDLTLNTQVYQFKIYFGGELIRTTDGAIVFDTTLIIIIDVRGDVTEPNQDTGLGIGYVFTPENVVLNNGSEYFFGFNVTSSHWTLTNCTLNLVDGGDAALQTGNVTLTGSSCVSGLTFNVSGQDIVTLKAVFVENATHTINLSRTFKVRIVRTGEFSLKNFLDDISSFGKAGFNAFTRAVIALILIFAMVVLVSKFSGLTNPDGVVAVIWVGVLLFSYVGWFTLELAGIPDIPNLRQYLILYLVSLVSVFVVIWRRS